MPEASPTPTIGRRIWFWPGPNDPTHNQIKDDQPFDAGVVFVHPDGAVSLVITAHTGFQFFRQEVQIREHATPGCAQWMPYQVAQESQRSKLATDGTIGTVDMGEADVMPDNMMNVAAAKALAASIARENPAVRFVHFQRSGKTFLILPVNQ